MDRFTMMEAFVRVVDAGGFSTAARRWGRSKAVVSKYVAALEAQLGAELLRRTTRTLSLTRAGAAYHDRCVDLLAELASMEGALHDDHAEPRGHLRVTAPPGLAATYFAHITTGFVARYPDVTMELDLTHRLVDLVGEGIDVAIRVTDPQSSTLIARRLAPAPIVAVASPAYLAANKRPRRPRDLLTHDCLVDTNFREQQRWRFRVGGRVESVTVRGPFRVNSPHAIRDLAIAGHGIALCPRHVVADALASRTLVEVLKGKVALDWAFYAVYPRRRFVSGRVRAFVDHLADALASHG